MFCLMLPWYALQCAGLQTWHGSWHSWYWRSCYSSTPSITAIPLHANLLYHSTAARTDAERPQSRHVDITSVGSRHTQSPDMHASFPASQHRTICTYKDAPNVQKGGRLAPDLCTRTLAASPALPPPSTSISSAPRFAPAPAPAARVIVDTFKHHWRVWMQTRALTAALHA